MKQERITITLPKPIKAWLNVVAEEDGKSASGWVSDVLTQAKRDRDAWIRHTHQPKKLELLK